MIDILKYVYNKLSTDTDVSDIVGDRIFPVIIPDVDEDNLTKVKFPVIVMDRLQLTPTYSKGTSCSVDQVMVSIVCWDTSYFRNVDLAMKVRTALDQVKGGYDDIKVKQCWVDSADEGYERPAYYQRIIFNLK